MKARYDAIIVGARVSGAATGLLLARAGARVLILDRDPVIGDTLSTHALMRPAVELLAAWGILDTLLDAGTPVVRQAHFQYGRDRVTVPVKNSDAVPGLCAPRRWLLDRTILDAAVAAGADLSLGVSVEACLADAADRIVGVSVRRQDGTVFPVHADLVIGADGRTSRVAEAVGAEAAVILRRTAQRRSTAISPAFRTGATAGISVPASRAARFRPMTASIACSRPAVPRTTGRGLRRTRTAACARSSGSSTRTSPRAPARLRPSACAGIRGRPGISARAPVAAGRWSATPRSSRTRRPRTASPMRSWTRTTCPVCSAATGGWSAIGTNGRRTGSSSSKRPRRSPASTGISKSSRPCMRRSTTA